MSFKYNKITIAGMGFMGGSLGLEIQKKKLARVVKGFSKDAERLNIACQKGAITDFTTNIEDAVKYSDIVVLCQNVTLIPEKYKEMYPYIEAKTAVTDVGSVKKYIVDNIRRTDKHRLFVGSHPMVGSEKRGVNNIKDNLYEGGVCIVTPDKYSDKKKTGIIKDFWRAMGMETIELSPAGHDGYVAGISHLPHLLAFALTNSQKDIITNLKKVIGKGFKDTTRIAASGEEIWSDIFITNNKELVKKTDAYIREVRKLRALVAGRKRLRLMKIIKSSRLLREALDK